MHIIIGCLMLLHVCKTVDQMCLLSVHASMFFYAVKKCIVPVFEIEGIQILLCYIRLNNLGPVQWKLRFNSYNLATPLNAYLF